MFLTLFRSTMPRNKNRKKAKVDWDGQPLLETSVFVAKVLPKNVLPTVLECCNAYLKFGSDSVLLTEHLIAEVKLFILP